MENPTTPPPSDHLSVCHRRCSISLLRQSQIELIRLASGEDPKKALGDTSRMLSVSHSPTHSLTVSVLFALSQPFAFLFRCSSLPAQTARLSAPPQWRPFAALSGLSPLPPSPTSSSIASSPLSSFSPAASNI